MIPTVQMRRALMSLYGGKQDSAWANRVRKMSEGQVIAIYSRLKKEGKL